MPTLATATNETADRIITGQVMTPAQREARTHRVFAAAADFASSAGNLKPLNPEWDRALLALLKKGDLAAVDSWSNAWIEEQAGGSAHEVRTWIAAYAALSAAGSYTQQYHYYRPVPELIAGSAVTIAVPQFSASSGRD